MLLEIGGTVVLIITLIVLYILVTVRFEEQIDKWLDKRLPKWMTPGKVVFIATVIGIAVMLVGVFHY
ncbi:MAG: hypothetical protein ACLU84_01455 [Clostridia bacterium]